MSNMKTGALDSIFLARPLCDGSTVGSAAKSTGVDSSSHPSRILTGLGVGSVATRSE